jgi:hypothetical protein
MIAQLSKIQVDFQEAEEVDVIFLDCPSDLRMFVRRRSRGGLKD